MFRLVHRRAVLRRDMRRRAGPDRSVHDRSAHDCSGRSDRAEASVHRTVFDPVLELQDARPRFDDSGLAPVRYNLRLNPGELALIECRDMQQMTLFADLCVGLVPLVGGRVCCMGLDWTLLDDRRRSALRGRIGRSVASGGWIDLYGTDLNILWPQLHHTRTSVEALTDRAVELGLRFGLPGLPVVRPSKLSALDCRRADCVRAFMGEPALLLFENPMDDAPPSLLQAFLASLVEVLERGAAVIWMTRNDVAGQTGAVHPAWRLRLHDGGLFSKRGS